MLLDTSVLIQLRDAPETLDRRRFESATAFAMSIITRIELEGGASAEDIVSQRRRQKLDELLLDFPVLDFDDSCAERYRSIVRSAGFSRRKTLDRMIAATALAHDLRLATLNGSDFADIPSLDLEVWTAA